MPAANDMSDEHAVSVMVMVFVALVRFQSSPWNEGFQTFYVLVLSGRIHIFLLPYHNFDILALYVSTSS